MQATTNATTNKERPLEGQAALVLGGGVGAGRRAALALAAHGVRVLVAGPQERPLAEVVGEIACAAGKGRHVVARVHVAAEVEAAVARAHEVFGALDRVIVHVEAPEAPFAADDAALTAARAGLEAGLLGAFVAVDVAARALRPSSRVVVLGSSGRGAAARVQHRALAELVAAASEALAPRGIAVSGVLTSDSADGTCPFDPETAADLAVSLCSGAPLTGQVLSGWLLAARAPSRSG